jgi:UDP-glucose:glycoprotein glucosyltransferase
MLNTALGAEVTLVLNPQRDITDMPLKTFYRYVLPASGPGGVPQPAAARFASLPPHKTLTLGMDVPEAW